MIRRLVMGPRAAGLCVILALAIGSSACGTTESAVRGDGAAASPIVAEATANVEEYFANSNAAFELPPVPDPGALRGKTVMYLSAGLAFPSGTAGVAALREVRDRLGFDLVTFDGQFTPSKYQEGMRQAVAQRVDALILYGVDCAGNEAALSEVRTAGIKIIGLQSVDCNEVNPSVPAMFDAQPLYPGGDSTIRGGEVWAANGAAQADYLISKLQGEVKVVLFDVPDFAVTASLGRGFKARLAECSTCEIVEEIVVAVADYGPTLQQKAEQALLKHPEANAVAINYDDLVTVGVSAAIIGSGRKTDLLTIAGTGYDTTMDLIRRGNGLNAGWAQHHSWDHYAGVDTVLRLLAGEQPAVSGIPVILYDKDHNMPPSGEFTPGTDYRSVFAQAWSAS